MPALIKLRDAGLRLVTLTNSSADAQRRQLDHAGITNLFDEQYSVEAVRAFKPHPTTYQMVAESEACSLSEMILVACHGWDTTGARLAGCRTAFISRPGNVELVLPIGGRADYNCTSLGQFADRIIGDLS